MYPGCNVFVGQKKNDATNLAQFAAITVMADFISYINSCGNNITLFYTPGVVQFPGRNLTIE